MPYLDELVTGLVPINMPIAQAIELLDDLLGVTKSCAAKRPFNSDALRRLREAGFNTMKRLEFCEFIDDGGADALAAVERMVAATKDRLQLAAAAADATATTSAESE